MADYPRRGRGKRHLNCEVYSACLEIAAAERWRDFHCEGCPKFEEGASVEPTTTKGEGDVKVCETCKQKPTIHPNSTECASCLAKRSHKKKPAKGEPGKALPKRSPRTGAKDYIDRVEARAEPVITVRFDKHEDILEQVERLADEQVRSPELQIIYMLKEHLNAVQKGVDAR